MKQLTYFVLAAIFMVSCTDTNDPNTYKVVEQLLNGGQKVEIIHAESDSAALMQFVAIGFADAGRTIKRADLINYKGDTINKRAENAAPVKSLSEISDRAFALTDELEKALNEGDKAKADSIEKLLDEVSAELKELQHY